MGSTRKGRDIDAALRKKGFRRDKTGDHYYYFFGATRIRTKISHGMLSSSLSAELIGSMSRQLRLTKAHFLDLVDCTLDEEGYRAMLQSTDNQE
jgi:hypothetical protein